MGKGCGISRQVRELYAQGCNVEEIATYFGCGTSKARRALLNPPPARGQTCGLAEISRDMGRGLRRKPR